jgi:hypothetical protein
MSLLAEHIPEHDRTRFAGEILDLKLLCSLDDFWIVRARLTQAAKIAFDVGHEHRHATRTEIFGERLQSDGLSRAGGTGDQAVAVRHLGSKKIGSLDCPTRMGSAMTRNYDFANGSGIVQRRRKHPNQYR